MKIEVTEEMREALGRFADKSTSIAARSRAAHHIARLVAEQVEKENQA